MKNPRIVLFLWFLVGACFCFCQMSCGQNQADNSSKIFNLGINHKIMGTTNNNLDTATFAAGCFWCVEAQFLQLDGVLSIKSGYTGGHTAHPSYQEVCTGNTGHAEAVNIVFDPKKISYEQLLEAFFLAHDPTQLNRQGNDIGTQYRSAIFPRNAEQKELALKYIAAINEQKVYDKEIVTQVEDFKIFYEAENYHDNYFARNPENQYCQMVVKPKLEKFKKIFKEKLKTEK